MGVADNDDGAMWRHFEGFRYGAADTNAGLALVEELGGRTYRVRVHDAYS
jgi:hypothetical protein